MNASKLIGQNKFSLDQKVSVPYGEGSINGTIIDFRIKHKKVQGIRFVQYKVQFPTSKGKEFSVWLNEDRLYLMVRKPVSILNERDRNVIIKRMEKKKESWLLKVLAKIIRFIG